MIKKSIQMPLVSIITVVYNGEKYLHQTIESVLSQTYSNIEYIIVDGGSTDNTIEIVKQYEDQIHSWVSEADDGLYDAMNKGIGLCSGELIGMINSDDWYEEDAVETMVAAYLEHPEKNIFHADRYDIDEEGNKKIRAFNESSFKLKYYGMTYNHPSMFISPREYSQHLYSKDFKSHSDYQFILEAFIKDKKKIHYINKPIVNYRLDGISAKMNWMESSVDTYKIRRKAGFTLSESIWAFLFTRTVIFIYRLKALY